MPFDLSAGEFPKYLPNFAANYTKRFLERGYDRAFQTKLGHWFISLNPWTKYFLEAFLYAVTSVLDERLPADSPFRKYASQVGLDAAPELSKRMINGARDEIAVLVDTARNPEEKEFLSVLLSLEDSDISNLLQWFGRTKVERKTIIVQFSLLSTEQRLRFLRLSEENKEKLIEFFGPKEKANQKVSEPNFGDVFRQDMLKAVERLRETKERMRQRRKRGRQ